MPVPSKVKNMSSRKIFTPFKEQGNYIQQHLCKCISSNIPIIGSIKPQNERTQVKNFENELNGLHGVCLKKAVKEVMWSFCTV